MTSLEMVNFSLKKLETLPFSVERNNVILELKAIRDELIVENIELLTPPIYTSLNEESPREFEKVFQDNYWELLAKDVIPSESVLNSDTTTSTYELELLGDINV